jgi:hypothetical protein
MKNIQACVERSIEPQITLYEGFPFDGSTFTVIQDAHPLTEFQRDSEGFSAIQHKIFACEKKFTF